MLDHVQTDDQIECARTPGKLLQAPCLDLAMTATAGQFGGLRIELDAPHLPEVHELGHRPARTAAGIEHHGGHRQGQAVQLGPDDDPPAAVPPVVLVDLEHHLHQAFVHRPDAVSYPQVR